MINDQLADTRAKFQRAEFHADELKARLVEFLSKEDSRPPVTTSFDPTHGVFIYSYALDEAVPHGEWATILGDALTNYRAALDYIAWVAAHAAGQSLTERQERRIYFPLSQTQEKFEEDRRTKLPGVTSPLIDIIARYQPARWPEAHRGNHPFSILGDLCNEDKHRKTIFTRAYTSQLKIYRPESSSSFIVDRIDAQRAVDFSPGVELFRVYGRPVGTTEPKLDLRIEAPMTVVMSNSGGHGVTAVLRVVKNMVGDLLGEVSPHLC